MDYNMGTKFSTRNFVDLAMARPYQGTTTLANRTQGTLVPTTCTAVGIYM
eukprot:SAG11_NODE_3716_length_2262_cov_6.154415_2_plen_50_part_00